jgi:RND family efflux transporter MFP subunit
MNTSSSWKKWLLVSVALLVLGGSIARAIIARKAQQTELAQSTESAQAQSIYLAPHDVHTVQVLTLNGSIPISGSLIAQRSAVVKAKVSAELQALHVREGDTVRQGQSLGQLDTQEVGLRRQQAQQQAASAKAIWTNAEQTLRNNQALVQQGFISRQALDTSLSNAASTRATFEAAQAAARLADKAWQDTRILAPLAGQIAQRFVQPGERLNVDARIVEIVDLDSLEWQVPLSPQDVAQVRVDATASLHIEGLPEPLSARIARINPSATADTRSVMVYLSLPRHPALRQGLFGQGQITVDTREGLAIPASAVSRDSGRDEVLRIDGDRIVRVPVQVGLRASRGGDATQPFVEITAGLKAGDRILPDASGTVREGARVTLGAATAATAASAPAASAPAASAASR